MAKVTSLIVIITVVVIIIIITLLFSHRMDIYVALSRCIKTQYTNHMQVHNKIKDTNMDTVAVKISNIGINMLKQ